MIRSLRASLGFYTRLPVGAEQSSPRAVLLFGPVVGALLGLACALAFAALWGLTGNTLLAAFAAVGLSAYLTRGLHLDGLADLADGLGSGRDRTGALEIMHRSDIGPFGVVAIVVALGLQVSALAGLAWGASGMWVGYSALEPTSELTLAPGPLPTVAVALAVALAGARLAPVWMCRTSHAARQSRLGAWAAGSVSTLAAAGVTALVMLSAGAVGFAWDGLPGVARTAGAVLLCAATGAGLTVLARRRFGGISGDVLGAAIEVSVTAALVALAIN